MDDSFAKHYLDDALESFRAYKRLAEKALAQITEEEYFATLDDESNSIAVILKHMAGNMLSRWADFLTTDGEKPDRNRDLEFVVEPGTTKESIDAYWERGWNCLFSALETLEIADFDRKVLIRKEEHTVIQAINRQLTHYAYHIGQLVFLAKHFRSLEWKSLSIPRNKSIEFNRYLESRSTLPEHRFEAATEFVNEAEGEKRLGITALAHVNITVPSSAEEGAKYFYGSVLGLKEIPKPEESSQSGAWYEIGPSQVHLSVEQDVNHKRSKRHICFTVMELNHAEKRLRASGVEILPDERPVKGCSRFYVRDPGGNLIEVASKTS